MPKKKKTPSYYRNPSSRVFYFKEYNPEGAIDWSQYPTVRYAVYQLELSVQGHPYFVGFVRFHSTHRLTYVRTLLPTAHWEKCINAKSARERCMLELTSRLESPVEYGPKPTPP